MSTFYIGIVWVVVVGTGIKMDSLNLENGRRNWIRIILSLSLAELKIQTIEHLKCVVPEKAESEISL